MRILVAHDAIGTDGGVETYLLSVMLELRRRGHQVALAYCTGGKTLTSAAAHVTFDVGASRLEAAADAIAGWKPDVCYSHNMGPLDVDRTLTARWPVVKMLHGFFGTCVSGLKMHAWPAASACSRTCGPACLALYLPRRCGPLSPAAMVRGYAWAREQRRMFARYRSLVVASRFMGGEVSRHGVESTRINVLPLFSTLLAAPSAPPVDAAGEPDTLLFAGRMTPLKGGHVLIAAAARAARTLGRPVRLIMAGDGPERDAWRQLASRHEVPVEMTGWVDVADRACVYARGMALVVPSLWPEPFGLVGLDAAAVGRPAIAFDVGGINEWLTDGVNGMLVEPAAGDAGLAAAIVQLLTKPEMRARMARASIEAAARLSVAVHVNSLEQVLLRAAA